MSVYQKRKKGKNPYRILVSIYLSANSFQASASGFHPMKTSENQTFSDVFRGLVWFRLTYYGNRKQQQLPRASLN